LGRTQRALAVVAILLALAAVAVRWWRRPQIGRVQRGWTVASRKGCFTCHGPGGIRGMADPGHGLDEIPPFAGGLITMYARSEGEIREWILDGGARRISGTKAGKFFLERQPIKMPAYRGHLKSEEVDRLVDYINWLRQHPY